MKARLELKSHQIYLFIIISLTLCNVVTALSYHKVTRQYIGRLSVASNSTMLLREELVVTQEETESFQRQLREKEEKNRLFAKTIEELNHKNELLQNDVMVLKSANHSSEELLKEYHNLEQKSRRLLEERDILIGELKDKLFVHEELNVFELPRRKKEFDQLTVWLEDGAHETYADIAMKYVNLLPANLLKSFQSNDWKLIITTRNLEEVYQSKVKNTVGLTIYAKKRIYLLNNEIYLAGAVIHEIAHALDYMNGYLSYSKEWLSIYNEEKHKSGFLDYFTNDPREYLAECMQQYYQFPELLHKNAPKSYQYIYEMMKEYSSKTY